MKKKHKKNHTPVLFHKIFFVILAKPSTQYSSKIPPTMFILCNEQKNVKPICGILIVEVDISILVNVHDIVLIAWWI